jgi:hypothetical protein
MDGVCLEIITPGKKNTPDNVITTTAPSGTDGTTGHITQANVPAGSYIGKFTDCAGASESFAAFYYGGTFDKAKATPFGVNDGGFTNLGTQLIIGGGTGWIDGTIVDPHNVGIPELSVIAYTASGKNVLDQSCSDNTGHFTSFNLPSAAGGVKLYFGKGANCQNDQNFKPTWYGGASISTATNIAITPGTSNPVNPTTLQYVHKGAATITSVAFSGTSSNPTVTVTGTRFGNKAPKPNPSGRPCGEPDVTSTGDNYGKNLIFWSTVGSGDWQAGFPGDCIGLVITSYSNTQIVFTLGDFYRDPVQNYHQMANGDTFSINVKGNALIGTVSGLS